MILNQLPLPVLQITPIVRKVYTNVILMQFGDPMYESCTYFSIFYVSLGFNRTRTCNENQGLPQN